LHIIYIGGISNKYNTNPQGGEIYDLEKLSKLTREVRLKFDSRSLTFFRTKL